MGREAQAGDSIRVLVAGLRFAPVTLDEELEPGYWSTSDPDIKIQTNDHIANQAGNASPRIGSWEFEP